MKFRPFPYLAIVSFALLIAAPALAATEVAPRVCTVLEVIDSGGYSYIRCHDGSEELWLGVMQVSLPVGTRISFHDTPPLVNFRTKSLDRTFPLIRFVPGVLPASEGVLEGFRPQDPDAELTPDMYVGTDDDGALVFTDDPAKAPRGAKKRSGAAAPVPPRRPEQ